MNKITVREQSPLRWGVYVNGTLVEGGFSDRLYAEEAAQEREWQDFQDQQEDQYEERVSASYQARGQSNLY